MALSLPYNLLFQVFQRRVDGTTNFNQNWTTYRDGFGDMNTNFWLGNDKLHYLTNQKEYKLRLDISTSSGTPLYSEFAEFQIESEDTKYRMNKLGTRTSPSGYAGLLIVTSYSKRSYFRPNLN